MMGNSVPIALEHHFFPKICVSANPDHAAPGRAVAATPISAKLGVMEVDGSNKRYMIELHVNVQAGPDNGLPYSIDVVCIGYATIQGEVPNETTARRMISEVGHRILFPAVRELVLTLTARQPWGPFSIGLGVLAPEPTPVGRAKAPIGSAKPGMTSAKRAKTEKPRAKSPKKSITSSARAKTKV